MFRHGGTSERDGASSLPCNACRASPIVQSVPQAKLEPVAHDGVGFQTCYRRVCGSTTDIVGAIQLSPYRAGIAGQGYTRLLTFPAFPSCSCSPPFRESAKMGRREVICL